MYMCVCVYIYIIYMHNIYMHIYIRDHQTQTTKPCHSAVACLTKPHTELKHVVPKAHI